MKSQTYNSLHICLSNEFQRLSTSPTDAIFMRYIFPIISTFGIIGNLLNLSVLLSKAMRSKANLLLSALAFADILFLLSFIPLSLANFEIFALNNAFRYVYFYTKMHFLFLANWTSAAAIWYAF